MSPGQRSRPAGNRTANKISAGDNTSVPPGTPKTLSDPLTEEQITDLVCSNTRARDVYFAGYLAGHREGMAAMELSQEQAAGLAARRFHAMEVYDVDRRRLVKETLGMADALVRRARMMGGA